MTDKRQVQKLVLAGVIALLFLSFPLISMANKVVFIASVPVLYVFVFGIWALLILVMFLLLRRKNPTRKRKDI